MAGGLCELDLLGEWARRSWLHVAIILAYTLKDQCTHLIARRTRLYSLLTMGYQSGGPESEKVLITHTYCSPFTDYMITRQDPMVGDHAQRTRYSAPP